MNKKRLNPAPWILCWLPAFVGVLIVIFSAATIYAVFLAMADSAVEPDPFLSIEYWIGKNENTSRSEVVRNLGLVLAAFIGIGIALWRLFLANKQQNLAERGHITDRINKAVENLGHKTTAVKLGGVHTLWRLIEEIPGRNEDARRSDVKMILDTLTAFARHNAKGRVTQDEDGKTVLRIDVETAVRLLGDKNAYYRPIMKNRYEMKNCYELNLRGANLSGGKFYGCDFRGADFCEANFSGATLRKSDFSGAKLTGTKFNNAKMGGVILEGAKLSLTDFRGANGLSPEQRKFIIKAGLNHRTPEEEE